MEQTIIKGFRVMIFRGYYGTQLFINNPNGDNIYAHKVSGDAMERALEVIGREAIEELPTDKMICLSERRVEFTEALQRGKDNSFEVYADWDKDAFVVVNQDNKAEYRVKLESRNGQVFGECECPDFIYRKRTCKHLGALLVDALFTVKI